VRRACSLLAVVTLLAGCGGGNAGSTRISSNTLSIYTGLPLRGLRAADGRAVLRGEKLALDDAGGHVGNLSIGLVALDDTDTSTGAWAPGQVAANARQAAESPTTIAYIGDLDSGASAVSAPITNEIGVLQVSPLSNYTGLTQPADKGEPAKYIPSGKRTFARLVPTGKVEAQALTSWITSLGIDRVALAYDGLQDGLGQGGEIGRALQAAHVQTVDVVRIDPRDGPADVVGDARDLARAPAPALVYAGASTTAALALLRAVHDRDPGEALFATNGVAEPIVAAGLEAAERQVHITSPLIPVADRPAPARRMSADYRRRFGTAAPPAALYGYEAMRGVLDAIRRAGKDGDDRQAVIDAYFHTAAPDSVLGPYAIDALGDTTANAYGAFRVRDGRLRFERLLAPAAG
jgi:branched-chain amino acid transport system substrate-binding protein